MQSAPSLMKPKGAGPVVPTPKSRPPSQKPKSRPSRGAASTDTCNLIVENAMLGADVARSQSQLQLHESRHANEVVLLEEQHQQHVLLLEENQRSELAAWKNMSVQMERRILTEESAIISFVLQIEALHEREQKLKFKVEDEASRQEQEQVICQRFREEASQGRLELLEIAERDEVLVEAARQVRGQLEAKQHAFQEMAAGGMQEHAVASMGGRRELHRMEVELAAANEELASWRSGASQPETRADSAPQLEAYKATGEDELDQLLETGLKQLGKDPLNGHVLQRIGKGRYTLGHKRIMMMLSENVVRVRDGSKYVSLEDWARSLEPISGSFTDTKGGQSLDLPAEEQPHGCDAALSPGETISRLRKELLDLQQNCSKEISRLSCGQSEDAAAHISALQELKDMQLRLQSLQSSSMSGSSSSAVELGRSGWRSLEMLAQVEAGPEVNKIGIAFEALPPSPMLVTHVAAGTWAADAAAIIEGDELLEVNGMCVRDLDASGFTALMAERPLCMRLWRCQCFTGVAPANETRPQAPVAAPDPGNGNAVLGSCATAQVQEQEQPPLAAEASEEDHFW